MRRIFEQILARCDQFGHSWPKWGYSDQAKNDEAVLREINPEWDIMVKTDAFHVILNYQNCIKGTGMWDPLWCSFMCSYSLPSQYTRGWFNEHLAAPFPGHFAVDRYASFRKQFARDVSSTLFVKDSAHAYQIDQALRRRQLEWQQRMQASVHQFSLTWHLGINATIAVGSCCSQSSRRTPISVAKI